MIFFQEQKFSLFYILIIFCSFLILISIGGQNLCQSLYFFWDTKSINKVICINKMNKLENLEPMMSIEDKALLYQGFNRSHVYFEVGSGTSTFQALKHGLKVISVESDAAWYNKMKQIFVLENIGKVKHKSAFI